MRYRDKVVLVVGGNSGIGRASAKAFAAEGARLLITGRDQASLDSARSECGEDAVAVRGDIADDASRRHVIDLMRDKFGRIDTLFINAGVGAFVPIEQVTEDDWDRIHGINLKGAYFMVQSALPLMGQGSAIVLNGSIGHIRGLPGNSVYGASKAGLCSLARTLGAELVGRGIRVNSVSPGPTDTPIIGRTQGVEHADVDRLRSQMQDATPMQRLGDPDEVARAVLFLGSDDASFITGQELVVDGGLVNF